MGYVTVNCKMDYTFAQEAQLEIKRFSQHMVSIGRAVRDCCWDNARNSYKAARYSFKVWQFYIDDAEEKPDVLC